MEARNRLATHCRASTSWAAPFWRRVPGTRRPNRFRKVLGRRAAVFVRRSGRIWNAMCYERPRDVTFQHVVTGISS